ncbi:MAG: hypothetical protein Q7K43_01395 [Candidatus Woesearchaeota archaeon]|nr:hypothetical protein [Candidatus Woesearchaeota archaeon]
MKFNSIALLLVLAIGMFSFYTSGQMLPVALLLVVTAVHVTNHVWYDHKFKEAKH